MIPIPVSTRLSSDVPLRFPARLCCNCGAQAQLELVPTTLRKTLFLGFGGVEKQLTVTLPYCPRCRKTAKRIPAGLFSKLLLVAVTFFGLVLAWSLLARRAGAGAAASGWILPVIAVLSAALVFGVFALQRPRGTQTSYYQPVRLRKLRQQFVSGKVVGYVLAFTNPVYRSAFAAENAEAIQRKAIEARDA
jgi:hypothetical protein